MRIVTLLAIAALGTLLNTACATVQVANEHPSAFSACSETEGYPDCQEGRLEISASKSRPLNGEAAGGNDSAVISL